QVADPVQPFARRRRGGPGPFGEAAPRGLDGAPHVLGPRLGEQADQVGPLGGVAVLEVVVAGRRRPLAGDEVPKALSHRPSAFSERRGERRGDTTTTPRPWRSRCAAALRV